MIGKWIGHAAMISLGGGALAFAVYAMIYAMNTATTGSRSDGSLNIVSVRKGGAADRAVFVPTLREPGPVRGGIELKDKLRKFNGAPAESMSQVFFKIAHSEPGVVVEFEVEREGRVLPFRLTLERLRWPRDLSLAFIIGLCYFAVGAFAYANRPSDTVVHLFYVLGAVALVGLPAPIDQQVIHSDRFLSMTSNIFSFMILPVVIHLSLLFPERIAMRDSRRRIILALVYLVPLALALHQSLLHSDIFENPSREVERKTAEAVRLGLVLHGFLMLLAIGIFHRSYLRVTEPAARRQLTIVLTGGLVAFVGGLTAVGYTIFHPDAVFGPNRWMYAMLLTIAFPIATGIALFRYRLLDI
ncbi:MAG: hypothetical protein ACRD1Z_08115, partial [Vicinamibacteria bacterium]